MRQTLPLLLPAPGGECQVCPYYTGNAAAPEPICSGNNAGDAWRTCTIREAKTTRPFSTSPCRTCPVRCGSRDDITAWMASVAGTLTFDDVALDRFAWPLNTRFVPLLDDTGETSPHRTLPWPAYGVPLRRVMSRILGNPGDPLLPQPRFDEHGAHAVLGLDEGQKAVLMGYGPDPLVERVWERRHTDRLIERIAAQGWDLVTTPDFSVYGDQPRTEMLFNLRRSLVFAQELSDAGVAVAPSIYWFRREDIDRWVTWIVETEPTFVCLPKHTLRHKSEWETMAAPGLEYLGAALDDAGSDVRVLVSGVSRPERVAQLASWFHARLSITAQNPVHLASQGRKVTPTGREVIQAHRADLFAHNVRFYSDQLDRVVGNAAQMRAGGSLPR